jgi:hypothetical protein
MFRIRNPVLRIEWTFAIRKGQNCQNIPHPQFYPFSFRFRLPNNSISPLQSNHGFGFHQRSGCKNKSSHPPSSRIWLAPIPVKDF